MTRLLWSHLILNSPNTYLQMCSHHTFRETRFLNTLGELRGDVLEIGFGEGDSLHRYTSAASLSAVEVKGSRLKQAAAMLQKKGLNHISLVQAEAENLPFKNHSFDAVSCSFVICSVQSQRMALQEIHRVLKPGGRFIAIEHTLSERPFIRGLQNLLTRPLAPISGNCHLNSEPLKVITACPLEIVRTDYYPYFLEPRLYIEARRRRAGFGLKDN